MSKLNSLLQNNLIVIKGAGDLASGVAYRLKRSGFSIIMTELPTPALVRRTVSFGEAVYSGQSIIEGITARRVDTANEAFVLATGELIPILVDPQATVVAKLKAQIVIDAILAKVNTGTTINDAPFVLALGPGFTVGKDCHAIIETKRGHTLGRVIYDGQAEPNTGTPGLVKGYGTDRVLRAPVDGHVTSIATIGERVKEGQPIASISGYEIQAPFDGVVRGLIHPKVHVKVGLKIGDLDPRGQVEHCFTISDKSLAIGGGVLEAVMSWVANLSPY